MKKYENLVDLEKPEQMRIWSQIFVSIQPRTSLEKSDVSWPTVPPQAERKSEGRRVGEGQAPRKGEALGALEDLRTRELWET